MRSFIPWSLTIVYDVSRFETDFTIFVHLRSFFRDGFSYIFW